MPLFQELPAGAQSSFPRLVLQRSLASRVWRCCEIWLPASGAVAESSFPPPVRPRNLASGLRCGRGT